jgi:hypothetical protein
MYRSFFISSILIGLSVFGIKTVYAAGDPITDFCSSPQAKADSEASRECADLEALQSSNLKIKGEKDSIEKEIKDIDSQIKIAQQKIKVQERIISQLSSDIGVKVKTVVTLQNKIDSQLESITSILRQINMHDSVSLPGILLGYGRVSEFFREVDEHAQLSEALVSAVDDVKLFKSETESEKLNLENRKDKETEAKLAVESQKRLIDRKKLEKSDLLRTKTGEYSVAQKLLNDKKQKVAAIRAKLFKFQDGEGIPFGNAYDYAAKASVISGVRPAFVLGILTQESSYDAGDSSFGKNVGKCFVRDANTGEGVSANDTTQVRQRVMKPDRIPAFQKMAADLGRDWMNTRVSCWIVDYDGGLPTGWGGAMGPAQFIATTWDNGKSSSLANRVARTLGVEIADPWNPQHAITAASFFLADLGAGTQIFSDEKNAACRYYSGKSCIQSSRANGYGVSVMKHVARVQEDVDVLVSDR